jgi:hypothetical protein
MGLRIPMKSDPIYATAARPKQTFHNAPPLRHGAKFDQIARAIQTTSQMLTAVAGLQSTQQSNETVAKRCFRRKAKRNDRHGLRSVIIPLAATGWVAKK